MNREMREKQLPGWMTTREGCNCIVSLYKTCQGIADGRYPSEMVGMLLGQEMIPAILVHEYPQRT